MRSTPSVLDPRGPAAAEIAGLSWVLFIMAGVIFAITLVMLLLAVRSRRRGAGGDGRWSGFIVGWGIAMPVLVLTVLMVLIVRSGRALSNAPEDPVVTVEVIARQFWWEYRYPAHGIVTANELHVPAGEPVRLQLTSPDVIHSFWVPQLTHKVDAIPGHETQLWLEAEEAGVYNGVCAEFCGIQHAKMRTIVVADTPDDFAEWLEREAAKAAQPVTESAERGRDVFLNSSCVECHAIRGETPPNPAAPDLTHLASRLTIAAGLMPNIRGTLAGWIMDPQSLKMGAQMPPTNLEGDELQDLLDYLESLE